MLVRKKVAIYRVINPPPKNSRHTTDILQIPVHILLLTLVTRFKCVTHILCTTTDAEERQASWVAYRRWSDTSMAKRNGNSCTNAAQRHSKKTLSVPQQTNTFTDIPLEIKARRCPLVWPHQMHGGNKTIKMPEPADKCYFKVEGGKKRKKNQKPFTLDCRDCRAILFTVRLWRSAELPNFFAWTFFFFQMRKKSFFSPQMVGYFWVGKYLMGGNWRCTMCVSV